MNGGRLDIPPASTLLAFEAVARLGSVSQAATERRTSPSAISRHIRNLEKWLGATLFERSAKGMIPTEGGKEYLRAVQTSIYGLDAAAAGLHVGSVCVTVACTQEISHYLLLPVFRSIKRSLGFNARLRILNCDYDMLDLLLPTGIDIVFEYSESRADGASARLLEEMIAPVASPGLVQRFAGVLAEHPRHWAGIPRLEVAQRNQPWASWPSWFREFGCEPPEAPVEQFENYQYLLDAAANGDGIAIGWDGFVNGDLRSGCLRRIGDEWMSTGVGLFAVLTEAGSRNRLAQDLLGALASAIPRSLGEVSAEPWDGEKNAGRKIAAEPETFCTARGLVGTIDDRVGRS